MRLLPYRKLSLRSALSAEAAGQALAKQVEAKRWFRFGSGSAPFEGSVSGSSFEIQRIIQYRNSFLPQITGTIRAEALGCSIAVTMRLHPFVLAFSAIWLSGVAAVGGMFGLSALAGGSLDLWMLGPLGMLMLVTTMIVGGFGLEARRAETLLIEIFAATREGVQ
jgi:hypothetical protein